MLINQFSNQEAQWFQRCTPYYVQQFDVPMFTNRKSRPDRLIRSFSIHTHSDVWTEIKNKLSNGKITQRLFTSSKHAWKHFNGFQLDKRLFAVFSNIIEKKPLRCGQTDWILLSVFFRWLNFCYEKPEKVISF